VVRVSGPRVREIGAAIGGALPAPRVAHLADFNGGDGALIDRGLVVFFPAPHSYTGEDVLELQGHGGPMVMRQLLERCLQLGARMAMPGEFTQRAFLNDRIDLAQAESVADLIDAASVEAARSAARSLAGDFSRRIHGLVEQLTWLRAHVEACIDFPEEEIDPATLEEQERAVARLLEDMAALRSEARQGAVLRDGLTVALAGRPNVGKSSLLNQLAGEDVAIVTPIAGTTRDYVRATVTLEGVPIHLVDTAGLREAKDEVERIGVERALKAAREAGAVMLVCTEGEDSTQEQAVLREVPASVPRVRVVNKIDLGAQAPRVETRQGQTSIYLSAKTGAGIANLRAWLLEAAGWVPHGEGLFMARARHVRALERAEDHLQGAARQQALELKAEELRLAQQALGAITGEVSADDLLGSIFSTFCIGK
jgi:tRNA modification GTPase